MKKIALILAFLSTASIAISQEKSDKNISSFELGSGLNSPLTKEIINLT